MESKNLGETSQFNRRETQENDIIKNQFKAILTATILAIGAVNCGTEKQLQTQLQTPTTTKYEGPDKDDSCCQECTKIYDTKANQDGTLTYKTFYPEKEMKCTEYTESPACKNTLAKYQTKIINCR